MVVCKSTQKKQRQYVKTPTKTPSAPCLFYLLKTKKMEEGIIILLIISLGINVYFLLEIGSNSQDIGDDLKAKQSDIYKAQIKTRLELISMEEAIINAIKTKKK